MASSDQFYYQFYYQLEFCYLRIQLNQMNQWEILCAMSRASSEEAAARQRQNQPARENVSRKRKVANGRGPGENGPAPLRTLKQYMIEEKLDIISYAKQAGNRAAGREYNVAESSIREWRKNEERLRYRRQEEILRATLALEPTRSRMPGAGRKPVEKKREECEEEEMIRQVPLSLRLMNEENIDLMHPSPSEVSPSVSGSSCPSTNSSPLTVVPESVSTTVSTGRLLQDSHGVCVPLPPSMRIPVPPCLDHFRGSASTFGMGRTDFPALPPGANLSQMISLAQYPSLQPYQSPPPLLSPPPIDDSLTLSTPGSGSSKRKAKNPRKIVLEDDVIPEAPVSVSVA